MREQGTETLEGLLTEEYIYIIKEKLDTLSAME